MEGHTIIHRAGGSRLEAMNIPAMLTHMSVEARCGFLTLSLIAAKDRAPISMITTENKKPRTNFAVPMAFALCYTNYTIFRGNDIKRL